MIASAGGHEPGRLSEVASGIGAQLDEEIVDRLIEGLPKAEDAHVRDAKGHLVRFMDRPDVQAIFAEHRHEIIRPDEEHLFLAVMARHDPRLMAVEHLRHDIGELALRGREVDRRERGGSHARRLGYIGQSSQAPDLIFEPGYIDTRTGGVSRVRHTLDLVDTGCSSTSRRGCGSAPSERSVSEPH